MAENVAPDWTTNDARGRGQPVVMQKRKEQGGSSVAERMGFEPTIPSPVYSLSRGAPSTTRPPLRVGLEYQNGPAMQD